MEKKDIGLVGLAVMGENLALNMASKGFSVCVYNRTSEKTRAFVSGRGANKNISAAYSVEELVRSVSRPRKIWMMIRAGDAVDAFIRSILPYLEAGDVLIDGGNSYFKDTIRRAAELEARGFYYIGLGVSGGEEGALTGPSLMPGGSAAAWPIVSPIFTAVCAKTEDGSPCCGWISGDGAGHFVKMVHNGIEYGDMQLICEAYQLMRDLLGLSAEEAADLFAEWNKAELNSYLIGITAEILAKKDEDDLPVIETILDVAGQKGTGKWASISALEEGVSLSLISEAVFARCLSGVKDERREAAREFGGICRFAGDAKAFLRDLPSALYAAKIISYAQGFCLIDSASSTYGWQIDRGAVAQMWRGGCIIRSAFLDKIKEAYDIPGLQNLVMAPYFANALKEAQAGWRRVVSAAAEGGVPVSALSSALCYFDAYRCANLPANLLQAQRDYFGAHTYERVDKPRGEFFHTDWTGHGGDTSATTYNV